MEVKNPYFIRNRKEACRLTEQEWKAVLPESLFHIARLKGTEYAFSGTFWNFEGIGTYYCAACGNALFESDAKFISSCGWPSFTESIHENSILYYPDHSHGMHRVEVCCGLCDAHLGHIFDDGPPPLFKRFCINSISIDFEPKAS